MHYDNSDLNIQDTFNLFENFANIQSEFEGTKGGASGEFFYLSKDRKLIMKTMNADEMDVIKESSK